MRLSFTLLLFAALPVCTLAQSNVFGLSSDPVFRSKNDSINYYLTTQQLKSAKSKAEADSLMRVRFGIQANGIRGYRYAYYPNSSFIQFDDLKHGEVEPLEVTHLSVSTYSGKDFPSEILACKNLEELELMDTRLEKLPKQLNTLTKLHEIRIYNNRPHKKLKLSKNTRITYLQIRGDKPEMLPASYRKLKALDSLDLSRNMLEKFPRIQHNKQLRQLMITDNNLTLDKARPSKRLENLFIHKNKINEVPSSIAGFRNLRKLVFSYNTITAVSPKIARLQKLEYLSFYQNKLTVIPKGVYELQKLKTIDLYFNQLDSVEGKIGNLKNLEVLYLSNNQLRNLPFSLGQLTSLRELYLHHNKLSTLPNLTALTNLRVLRVNENFLFDFPDELIALTYLENLDLSGNELRQLPESILQFDHLRLLGLSKNPWENPQQVSDLVKALEKKGTVVHVGSLEE